MSAYRNVSESGGNDWWHPQEQVVEPGSRNGDSVKASLEVAWGIVRGWVSQTERRYDGDPSNAVADGGPCPGKSARVSPSA